MEPGCWARKERDQDAVAAETECGAWERGQGAGPGSGVRVRGEGMCKGAVRGTWRKGPTRRDIAVRGCFARSQGRGTRSRKEGHRARVCARCGARLWDDESVSDHAGRGYVQGRGARSREITMRDDWAVSVSVGQERSGHWHICCARALQHGFTLSLVMSMAEV